MARLTTNADDKTNDLATKIEEQMDGLIITTAPIVITGVQRKANVGNYETIDIYCAVALPQPQVDVLDQDALMAAVQKAAEVGFYMTSKETGERYDLIKKNKGN